MDSTGEASASPGLSGWVEGSIQTGLQAVAGIVKYLIIRAHATILRVRRAVPLNSRPRRRAVPLNSRPRRRAVPLNSRPRYHPEGAPRRL